MKRPRHDGRTRVQFASNSRSSGSEIGVEIGRRSDAVNKTLSTGRNVVVHCRQGIGRSGLVAACLRVKNGMSPGAAVEIISAARGVPILAAAEYREWIDHYATALT